MSDATDIPILLDADTGYGNFNNARRLVTKLEQRGVAGACIEDKLFPKTNSLLDGRAQPLADIDEFCAKIRACKGTVIMLFAVMQFYYFFLHIYLKASIEQLLKKFIYNYTKWQLLISLPHTLDLFHSAHLLGNLHMQQKRQWKNF